MNSWDRLLRAEEVRPQMSQASGRQVPGTWESIEAASYRVVKQTDDDYKAVPGGSM